LTFLMSGKRLLRASLAVMDMPSNPPELVPDSVPLVGGPFGMEMLTSSGQAGGAFSGQLSAGPRAL
jgi:hypothetical protein